MRGINIIHSGYALKH